MTLIDQKNLVDDLYFSGTMLITNIYPRCNTAICEAASIKEVEGNEKWVSPMMEEMMMMIERNQTFEHVHKPQD